MTEYRWISGTTHRNTSRTFLSGKGLTAGQAWTAIACFVLFHELTCQPGQLLSEGVDRGLEKRPVLVYSFITITVAHLLNQIPLRVDPYSRLFQLIQRLKGHKV